MDVQSKQLVIWLVYLVASFGALAFVWRVCQIFASSEVRRVILLCFMALLWTPARLAPDTSSWVPAFMAALMEAIAIGDDAAISRGLPILLVMVTLLCLSLLWHFYTRRVARKPQETP